MKGHNSSVNSVAFNYNGILLASGSYDSTIKLWNLETKTEIATLEELNEPISSVAFNHDGTLLASGYYDSTIKLWNIETKTGIATLEGHD